MNRLREHTLTAGAGAMSAQLRHGRRVETQPGSRKQFACSSRGGEARHMRAGMTAPGAAPSILESLTPAT